jgi:hydrogenase maturation protein HypF
VKRRVAITVRGAVQGVGFRPFVYRLAVALGLCGGVRNTADGVFIEAEGPEEVLQDFLVRLREERPGPARIRALEAEFGEPRGCHRFEVRGSEADGVRTAWVMPDLATCPQCVRELFDPGNRRFRHPFISCSQCGPRFSMVEGLPYDRSRTSMRGFPMCLECGREYEDPADRRFHAQTIACLVCGPRLRVLEATGEPIALAVEALRSGLVVALKGIGGFQLLAAAHLDRAVDRLRLAKQRVEKPFALMVPDLATAAQLGDVGRVEAELLGSSAAPIVLLRARAGSEVRIAPGVAPGLSRIGVMLPYSPVHHLLLADLGFPIVATSGNRSEEPICISEEEALERLGNLADLFVVNDRPIVRPLDDSLVQVVGGREQVLRRARGYAPLPIELAGSVSVRVPVLAVGGHLKNSVALAFAGNIHLSGHVGDLVTPEAGALFRKTLGDLADLYGVVPERIACDQHPDYHSTLVAEGLERPLVRVPHHRAHVLACMADHGWSAPVLGVAWDGTGLGEDGVIWGGEFLLEEGVEARRVAHLHPFRLPGGEAAISHPSRSAMSVLFEAMGREGLEWGERRGLWMAGDPWARVVETADFWPWTTSAGRLFDAVAALIGLRSRSSYEGQAAMELESLALGVKTDEIYTISFDPPVMDWRPMIREMVGEVSDGVEAGLISVRFHNTLAGMIRAVAEFVGCPSVVLTGGCFQNRLLTESSVEQLTTAGFRTAWHQRIPPNDGGLAVGQILAAL